MERSNEMGNDFGVKFFFHMKNDPTRKSESKIGKVESSRNPMGFQTNLPNIQCKLSIIKQSKNICHYRSLTII